MSFYSSQFKNQLHKLHTSNFYGQYNRIFKFIIEPIIKVIKMSFRGVRSCGPKVRAHTFFTLFVSDVAYKFIMPNECPQD